MFEMHIKITLEALNHCGIKDKYIPFSIAADRANIDDKYFDEKYGESNLHQICLDFVVKVQDWLNLYDSIWWHHAKDYDGYLRDTYECNRDSLKDILLPQTPIEEKQRLIFCFTNSIVLTTVKFHPYIRSDENELINKLKEASLAIQRAGHLHRSHDVNYMREIVDGPEPHNAAVAFDNSMKKQFVFLV